MATVTGWGTLSSGGAQPTVLQEVNVTITTNSACNAAYGTITDMMVCASAPGKDSCQGDSGGPLVLEENQRHALVGVVSWGGRVCQARVPRGLRQDHPQDGLAGGQHTGHLHLHLRQAQLASPQHQHLYTTNSLSRDLQGMKPRAYCQALF